MCRRIIGIGARADGRPLAIMEAWAQCPRNHDPLRHCLPGRPRPLRPSRRAQRTLCSAKSNKGSTASGCTMVLADGLYGINRRPGPTDAAVAKEAGAVGGCSFCAVVSGGLMYGQTAAVTMTTGRPCQTKLVLRPLRNTIHNSSSVPVAAWVISTKFRKPGRAGNGSYSVEDYAISGYEITPGGQATLAWGLAADSDDVESRLVAGLFEDGSTFGDPEWAKLVLLCRKNAFRTLSAVIADLEAVKNMPQPQMIEYLDASRHKQEAGELALRDASSAVAIRLPANDLQSRDLFVERSPQLKAANVQSAADSDGLNRISGSYYSNVETDLGDKGSLRGSPQDKVRQLIGHYSFAPRKSGSVEASAGSRYSHALRPILLIKPRRLAQFFRNRRAAAEYRTG